MFSSQSNFSQTSNSEYGFMHNGSQGSSSQFDLDGIGGLNKNNNNLFGVGVGELDTINEEGAITPIKIGFDTSKKDPNIQGTSQLTDSVFSFGGGGVTNNLSLNIPNKSSIHLNITNNKSRNDNNNSNIIRNNNKNNFASNKEEDVKMLDVNNNSNNNSVNINNNKNQMNQNPPSRNENAKNFDSYKMQLSQQIDTVEKIASQSLAGDPSSFNPDSNTGIKNSNNINCSESYQPRINLINSSNTSEQELLEHQRFNSYISEKLDNVVNKNIEYIDLVKSNLVNQLDDYKMKFKGNANTIKNILMLYSDDTFQKEKNKLIVENLVQQLYNHINSFFLEMNKFRDTLGFVANNN